MSLTTNNNFKIKAWQLADDVGDGHDMVQCDVRSVLAVHFEVVYYNKYHFLVLIFKWHRVLSMRCQRHTIRVGKV